MNERIKELILEAGFPAFGKMYVVTDGAELEKFAELIVRECSGTAASCFVGWPMDGREQRHTCCIAIKKHFGVEQ